MDVKSAFLNGDIDRDMLFSHPYNLPTKLTIGNYYRLFKDTVRPAPSSLTMVRQIVQFNGSETRVHSTEQRRRCVSERERS